MGSTQVLQFQASHVLIDLAQPMFCPEEMAWDIYWKNEVHLSMFLITYKNNLKDRNINLIEIEGMKCKIRNFME